MEKRTMISPLHPDIKRRRLVASWPEVIVLMLMSAAATALTMKQAERLVRKLNKSE